MPIYDFYCPKCDFEKEVFSTKIIDLGDHKEFCAECEEKLRKKISKPTVVYKGAGYYETEHGRQKHNHFTPEQGREEVKDRQEFIEKAQADMESSG